MDKNALAQVYSLLLKLNYPETRTKQLATGLNKQKIISHFPSSLSCPTTRLPLSLPLSPSSVPKIYSLDCFLVRYLLVDKEISPDGLRHPSSRPLRNVRSEFRTTYEQFGSEPVQREITQVYSGVSLQPMSNYK